MKPLKIERYFNIELKSCMESTQRWHNLIDLNSEFCFLLRGTRCLTFSSVYFDDLCITDTKARRPFLNTSGTVNRLILIFFHHYRSRRLFPTHSGKNLGSLSVYNRLLLSLGLSFRPDRDTGIRLSESTKRTFYL